MDETNALSIEQAEQIQDPEFHPKARSRSSGLIVILVGPILLVVGGIVLFFTGPFSAIGFVPLLIGMFATAVGINWIGSVRPRGWRGRAGVGTVRGVSDDRQSTEAVTRKEEE